MFRIPQRHHAPQYGRSVQPRMRVPLFRNSWPNVARIIQKNKRASAERVLRTRKPSERPPVMEPGIPLPTDAQQVRTIQGVLECLPYSVPGIERFDRIARMYARLVQGYRSRTALLDYLVRRLKQKVNACWHKETKWILQAIHRERLKRREAVQRVLDGFVRDVLEEIQRRIRNLATCGRKLKNELPPGRMVFLTRIQEGVRPSCHPVCREERDGTFTVIALQTTGEFRRRQRRRRRGDADEPYRHERLMRRRKNQHAWLH